MILSVALKLLWMGEILPGHKENTVMVWCQYTKRIRQILSFAFVSLILFLILGCQQSAIAQSAKNTAELPVGASQSPGPSRISPKTSPDANNLSPRISFEKTVCDLGDVGQGTKNTCEFKFTNTGQALLKIGKINQICG